MKRGADGCVVKLSWLVCASERGKILRTERPLLRLCETAVDTVIEGDQDLLVEKCCQVPSIRLPISTRAENRADLLSSETEMTIFSMAVPSQ